MPDKPKPKKRKVCHGIQEDDQELCAPSKSSSVIKSSCSSAQIRAAFYPKFENEKSDHEIRARMIELVSNGLATLEVTLKHSGSLFMYAGHEGGAYAKNSFGNIYTAVGVFVLGRMFQESWGTKASKKQEKFNYFLKKNHMCISMELVTAVLGDHGQRPIDDYVIVTAISELGDGKPKFYSTSDIIAFCRKWRLPTNHVWLFSTRKSVTTFFAAFDTLREEGIATHVCQALNEIADISVPGSKDHVKVQGEILEGLVARIVSHESLQSMEQVLKDYPPKFIKQGLDLRPSLREICATHRHEEKQQIKALLESAGRSFCPDYSGWFGHGATDKVSKSDSEVLISRFLQSRAADFSTSKLQETINLMRERCYRVHFKCYNNIPSICPTSSNETSFRLVIHILSDEVFQQYQKEMRKKGLWPLYRGFFVDINIFEQSMEEGAGIAKICTDVVKNVDSGRKTTVKDGLAEDDANLMLKLKFLTYMLRTFLIRNGLSTLFNRGSGAYKTYYLRQMTKWNISTGKKKQLTELLDKWAVHIQRKYGKARSQPLPDTYLSEAEPFLEEFAKLSPKNQALVGTAGSLVRAEDFMAILDEGMDEDEDLEMETEVPSGLSPGVKATKQDESVIVFFPGIPGCGKSALCKLILDSPGVLGDDRPVLSLMGDLVKGQYWAKVDEACRRKPSSILLADKNAPNEEVWSQIEEMCGSVITYAVPVITDTAGTETNPYSLDALAVFAYRILRRANHPGNLDKNSQNVGYVLLLFYCLYEGTNKADFELELVERFGSLVRMPLLKPDRDSLPGPIKSVLEEGLQLYKRHQRKHGRWDSSKGSYMNDWVKWEKELKEIIFSNAGYLNSIQVSFEDTLEEVTRQLRAIVKGGHTAPCNQKRRIGSIRFAAVSLQLVDIQSIIQNIACSNCEVKAFLKGKNMKENLKKAHVTLAHKTRDGVAAVAKYGEFLDKEVAVELTALLFTGEVAALEASLGSVNGDRITAHNRWTHVTVWTNKGVAAKEANSLQQLHSEGEAVRIEINPSVVVMGVVRFF